MTKPPTSTNITEVARDVRRYFAAGVRYGSVNLTGHDGVR